MEELNETLFQFLGAAKTGRIWKYGGDYHEHPPPFHKGGPPLACVTEVLRRGGFLIALEEGAAGVYRKEGEQINEVRHILGPDCYFLAHVEAVRLLSHDRKRPL